MTQSMLSSRSAKSAKSASSDPISVRCLLLHAGAGAGTVVPCDQL